MLPSDVPPNPNTVSETSVRPSFRRSSSMSSSLVGCYYIYASMRSGRQSPASQGKECTAMLKNLDPLLNGALLQILADMGHGNEIVIVDANYTASADAKRLVRLD